jgi:hypothetical protein
VEALNLSIGLWAVGLGAQVLDLSVGQQFAERAVAHVVERVVGHQSLGVDVVRGEPLHGPGDERGDGRGLLVLVQLDEGQAGVVVDDCVREHVADPGVL